MHDLTPLVILRPPAAYRTGDMMWCAVSLGRDAIDPNVLRNCPTSSEDGQPIGERTEPFFDDVPQMLVDIDETMYRARLYHDAVVHSDAEV